MTGVSHEERQQLMAMYRLEAQAEAELHRLEARLEDMSHRQLEVRRRLVRH